ncbi:MAG: hypothetical protein ACFFKA_05790 [Candidatus Thorarchaeota archaeon]
MAENGLLGILNAAEMSIEQKIVEELLNGKNLETKTELNKPILWSCMKLIEDFLESKKLSKSSIIIRVFTEYTFRYLISKDRKGRTEYLEALKGLRDKLQSNNPIAMGNNALKT